MSLLLFLNSSSLYFSSLGIAEFFKLLLYCVHRDAAHAAVRQFPVETELGMEFLSCCAIVLQLACTEWHGSWKAVDFATTSQRRGLEGPCLQL